MEPLLDLLLLVKVQTKAGPTSSSNRDFPNQGLYGQRLDLEMEKVWDRQLADHQQIP